MEEKKKEPLQLKVPMLVLRGLVLYPKMVLHFDVGRAKSIMALNEAMSRKQLIYLVAQRDSSNDSPKADQLYRVGVVAQIKQILKTQSEAVRVLVEGKFRARTIEVAETSPFYQAIVQEYPLKAFRGKPSMMASALMRTVKDQFDEYVSLSPRMPRELVMSVMNTEDPVFLVEFIAGNIPIRDELKQAILEESSVTKRLELMASILESENDILSVEHDIYEKVRDQVDRNQREYYLREQMKAISAELGDGEDTTDEVSEYHETIKKLEMDGEYKEKLHKEADRLLKMSGSSQEAAVIRGYLDNVLEMPWNQRTKDKIDIVKAQKQLDKDHYGLTKVKERILEVMAVRKLAPDIKGQIICLDGPPGVGKTSIAKSIAKAMGRNYARISLGGVRDESDIRGHRKTYVGSMPGRIVNGLKQAKSRNPVLLLDEIDKLGNDFRGDPASALLEVLDSEQNNAFRDHYIEIPFDLSEVLFIATANDLNTVPRPLLDRMEVISITSYTREEKFQIARRHLLPKQMKRHGLNGKTMKIADDAIYGLIDYYSRESGVRGLERLLASLCRKSAKEIVSGEAKVVITAQSLETLLGPNKYHPEHIEQEDEVGMVNGLAWTSVGGEMLQVEVAVLEGSGKLELTGSLGDVMKESARAAVTYIRSCAEQYGIDKEFYKNKDIHIHVPEGAVPKDGPSAGVTICTAVTSALSGIPVRRDVAMTGEITLRGRVLPIGGLREKTMAAYRAGVKTVLIPKDNLSDLEEVDPVVKDSIRFITAEQIDTVLDTALVRTAESKVMQAVEEPGAKPWKSIVPPVKPQPVPVS
jgi:ATP-dependent Lon protease